MDLSYLITPFFSWLVAGSMKFIVNSYKAKRLAFNLIGYGGMPSNHSSIVSSTVVIIALNEGIGEPALVIALAFAFIVILDAASLRQQVGKHATVINALNKNNETSFILRERIGHTRPEIIAGIITGAAAAGFVYVVFKFL